MKQLCSISLKSIAVLCVSTLLFSLIFAILYYFTWISTSFFHNANWICGLLSFGAAGAMLGYLAQKKALLHAFVIVLLLLGIALLLTRDYTMMAIVKTLSKGIAFLSCCLLTYTKAKKD